MNQKNNFAQSLRNLEHNLKPTSEILDAAAIIGSLGRSTIIQDLDKLIEQKKFSEIDGYVLCLSRVMKKDFAWICILKAFSNHNNTVPSKYYRLFDISPDKEEPVKRFPVG